jgi:hypothetical protein
MKASDVSFKQMLVGARNNQNLGIAASYMQVEYGISELEASWDGFVHTSDHYGSTFKSRKEIYLEFANALTEYFEYLGEPLPDKMGSTVSENS